MTAAAPPADPRTAAPSLSLGLLLAMQAAMQPRRRFLVGPRGRSWTFQETDAAASHVGWSLRQLGVPSGAPVMLLAPNSDRALIALAGVMRIGCQPILAPPTLPFADGFAIATALRPVAIIGENSDGGATMATAARLASASASVGRLAGFGDDLPAGATDLGPRIERARVAIDVPRIEDAAEALSIRFAHAGAGAVERPMATLLSACVALAAAAGLRSADRVVSPMPPADPAGLVCGLFASLFAGAEFAPLDAPDSKTLAAALDTDRARHLVWPRAQSGLAAALLGDAPPLRSLIRSGRTISPDDDAAQTFAGRAVDVTLREDGEIDVTPPPATEADAATQKRAMR